MVLEALDGYLFQHRWVDSADDLAPNVQQHLPSFLVYIANIEHVTTADLPSSDTTSTSDSVCIAISMLNPLQSLSSIKSARISKFAIRRNFAKTSLH